MLILVDPTEMTNMIMYFILSRGSRLTDFSRRIGAYTKLAAMHLRWDLSKSKITIF